MNYLALAWVDTALRLEEERDALREENAELVRANHELRAGLVAFLFWVAEKTELAQSARALIEQRFPAVVDAKDAKRRG